MIYFDNSATTLQKPETVAKAVYDAIASEHYANPGRSAHAAAHNALEALFTTRRALARIFGIKNPLNIALCQNATAALNMVIKSLFNAQDHIITTAMEHNSVLRPLYQLEQAGADLSIIGFEPDTGVLHYDEIAASIQQNTKAVIVNACSNVTGAVCDIDRVYRICQEHGLILIIDASQSAGSIPFNVSEYENTIACFTGHKGLYGPQGTGGIAVNGSFAFQPVFSGGSGVHSFDKNHPTIMPDAFEAGTMNVPSFAGLTAGCAYVENYGIERIQARLAALRQYFCKKAAAISHIQIYAQQARNVGAAAALNVGQIPSGEVSRILDERYGIATRPGAHCAPLIHKTYHTEKQGMVRFSFSTFNTEAEIDTAVQALKEISKECG